MKWQSSRDKCLLALELIVIEPPKTMSPGSIVEFIEIGHREHRITIRLEIENFKSESNADSSTEVES